MQNDGPIRVPPDVMATSVTDLPWAWLHQLCGSIRTLSRGWGLSENLLRKKDKTDEIPLYIISEIVYRMDRFIEKAEDAEGFNNIAELYTSWQNFYTDSGMGEKRARILATRGDMPNPKDELMLLRAKKCKVADLKQCRLHFFQKLNKELGK